MLTRRAPVQKRAASGSRRLDIQGLRAVAVILVVAFHAGLPISGGFIGVDVFLVISGFVIMGLLMRELRGTGTIKFRTFYSRRAKRLLPALAVLTTTVAALSVFLGSSFGSQQTTAKTGLGATFFSANVVIYRATVGYFTPEAATNPLLHTWTLSVEEQVYLVFPALLLGSWIVGRRLLRASRRGTAVMLTLVGASSFLLCLLVSFGRLSSPPQFAFYSSLARIWEFAIGAALALLSTSLKRIPPRSAAVLGLAGACALGVGAFTISGSTPYPGFAVLLPVFGAAAIIISGFHPTAWVTRLLATKPMARIGDLSYAWYLWHWPLIVFGAILWPAARWALVVLGALSLVPAWLSTTFLEDPIRKNAAIKGRRVVALGALCTLIPTAAFLGLAAGARTSWGNEEVANMQAQVGAEHAGAANGCVDAPVTGSSIVAPGCQWDASATDAQRGPRVYLVGNSVAEMYSEALIGASHNLGIPLTIDTSHGCFFDGQNDDRDCSDNFTGTVERLAQEPPGIVVMSSTWDLGDYGGDPSSDAGKTAHEKAQLLITSLTAAIERLRGSGHRVVIVLPTPRFFHAAAPGRYLARPDPTLPRQEAHTSAWRPEDCATSVAQSDPANCGATVPQAQEDAAQGLTLDALEKVAERTDSRVVDLRSRFCWGGMCRTNDGNRWLYKDGIHISVAESQALAPTFTFVLRQIVRKNWGVPRADGAGDPSPTRP